MSSGSVPADGASRSSATADGSWMGWTAAGITGIWVAVVSISLFSPDMVSGSEQQHFPVAAFCTWCWGLIATGAFLLAMGRLRGKVSRQPIWIGLAVAILAIWLAATVMSIALPEMVTGTDPTRIPIAALVSPVAAMVFTGLASIVAGVFFRRPEPG